MNEKPKILNVKEAKELVARYRAITLEDIDSNKEFSLTMSSILHAITGFSNLNTCTLCTAVGCKWNNIKCDNCIHIINSPREIPECGIMDEKYPCNMPGSSEETYEAIESADSAKELLEAVAKRADYLESVIKMYEEGNYGRI